MESEPHGTRVHAADLEELRVVSRDALDLELEEILALTLVVMQPAAVKHGPVPLEVGQHNFPKKKKKRDWRSVKCLHQPWGSNP